MWLGITPVTLGPCSPPSCGAELGWLHATLPGSSSLGDTRHGVPHSHNTVTRPCVQSPGYKVRHVPAVPAQSYQR